MIGAFDRQECAIIVLVARVHRGKRARLLQRRDDGRVGVARIVEFAEMALVVDDALRLLAAEQWHMFAVIAVRPNRVRHLGSCPSLAKKRAFAVQMSKSSAPWPGAVCTKPVPVSSVTWSPSSSGTLKS